MKRYLFIIAIFISIVMVKEAYATNVTVYPSDRSTSHLLTAPKGLCYIPEIGITAVDEITGKIIYINSETGLLTELLTADQTGLASPSSIAASKDGVLYITDAENNIINSIVGDNIHVLAGTGEAGYTESSTDGKIKSYISKFNYPMSVAVDSKGNVYISDTLNHCIRKIDKKGNLSVVAGVPTVSGYKDGYSLISYFNEPSGIFVDKKGNIYVADSGNHRIRMISSTGMVTTIAGTTSISKNSAGYYVGGFIDGDVENAKFNFPKDVAVSEDGVIFVADTYNNAIRAIFDGKVITICGTGVAGANYSSLSNMKLNKPSGVLVHGDSLYISDTLNGSILKLSGISFDSLSKIPSRREVGDFINLKPYNQNVAVYFRDSAIDFEYADIIEKGEDTEVQIEYICNALGYYVIWNYYDNSLRILKDSAYYTLYDSQDFYLKDGRAYTNINYLVNLLNIRAEWFPEQNIFVLLP